MSLRPAQELVEGSSTFSLRHFFEQQQPPQPQPQLQPQMQAQQHSPPQSLPIRSPAELSLSAMDGVHPFHAHAPSEQPFARSHIPTPIAMPTAAAAHPKESKFTFTGLMPAATTPIQMQHKILAQHQQQALSQGAAPAKPTALNADSTNEVLRLKAQVVQLNEKLTQANVNLATTSESVVRGNKALTTERAQFHAKYASLTKKLETTQAALAEAEALPKEDIMNAKLLNAKVLELQTENERLAATHAELEMSLSKAEATAAETAQALALAASESSTTATATAAAAADAVVPTAEEEERQAQQLADLADLREKFTNLSAQHSSLINKKIQLEETLKGKEEDLLTIEEELGAAIERAEEAELEVVELRDQAETSKRELAQTDSLVDVLDEKLATARAEAVVTEAAQGMAADEVLEEVLEETEATTEAPVPAECCCPETMRCEELERDAQHARNMINGARQEEHKQRYEDWQFADSLARRARHALTTGEPERIIVAHVHAGNVAASPDNEPRFDLSEHIAVHPRPMGEPLDDSCLHCAVDIGAGAERDTTTAAGRTTAFVQAVSKDLKLSMDGSQALYASSSTTGVALRV